HPVAAPALAFQGESEPSVFGACATEWDPTQDEGHKTTHGLHIVHLQIALGEQLGELAQRKTCGDPDPTVLEPLHRGDLVVVLVGDLTDDLLDDVFQGDQARSAAVLVDGDRHVVALLLHLPQQFIDGLAVGHVLCRTHDVRGGQLLLGGFTLGRGPPITQTCHQILEVDDANDVVLVLTHDGDTRVATGQCGVQYGARVMLTRREDDVGTGHHHLADRGVVELEHRVDHLTFLGVDDVPSFGQIHQPAQLHLCAEGAVPVPLGPGCQGPPRTHQQSGRQPHHGLHRTDHRGTGQCQLAGELTAQDAWRDRDQ